MISNYSDVSVREMNSEIGFMQQYELQTCQSTECENAVKGLGMFRNVLDVSISNEYTELKPSP